MELVATAMECIQQGDQKMQKYKPISKIELEKLPENTVKEVKDTLKAYDECQIVYQNGKYETSAGCGIYSSYPTDYKFIGVCYLDDIYTREEQLENYLTVFHSYPSWYVGKRDFDMLREKYGYK